MQPLTHFSLFTGFGGIDIAAEIAGIETVGQCEINPAPTQVLKKHWAEVPRWEDIRNVTRASFEQKTGRRTVDVLSGGFPCQPFSTAGKRRGDKDDRYLWLEMLRVIKELQPTWVIGENVAGIINMALDRVCADLEAQGYEVQPIVFPAMSVQAQHRRNRVFILAHANPMRQPQPPRDKPECRQWFGNSIQEPGLVANTQSVRQTNRKCAQYPVPTNKKWADAQSWKDRQQLEPITNRKSLAMADTDCQQWHDSDITKTRANNKPEPARQIARCSGYSYPSWAGGEWQQPQPAIDNRLNPDFVGWLMGFPCGWAHNISVREQIKGYGNAVVPQQILPIMEGIAAIEGGNQYLSCPH